MPTNFIQKLIDNDTATENKVRNTLHRYLCSYGIETAIEYLNDHLTVIQEKQRADKHGAVSISKRQAANLALIVNQIFLKESLEHHTSLEETAKKILDLFKIYSALFFDHEHAPLISEIPFFTESANSIFETLEPENDAQGKIIITNLIKISLSSQNTSNSVVDKKKQEYEEAAVNINESKSDSNTLEKATNDNSQQPEPSISKTPKDIVCYKKNSLGKDYIVGDIHGSLSALQKALELLKPTDRLFIVGDLIDRGENSLAVLDIVLNDPRIISIKGNHEAMLLDTLNLIAKYDNKDDIQPSNNDINIVINYLQNGGDWILSSPLGDKCNAKEIKSLAKKILKGEAPLIDKARLEEIKEKLEKLPYIAVVGSMNSNDRENTFIVCHADMPFSDDELAERIAGLGSALPGSLTEYEINQAIWERPDLNKPTTKPHRGPLSILVYCGHSIVINDWARVYREDTNHINIDFGAYCHNVLVVVNHTDKKLHFCSGMNYTSEAQLEQQLGCPEKIKQLRAALAQPNRQRTAQSTKSTLFNEALKKSNDSNTNDDNPDNDRFDPAW